MTPEKDVEIKARKFFDTVCLLISKKILTFALDFQSLIINKLI